MFQKRVKSKSQRCCPRDVAPGMLPMHAAIPVVIKPDPPQEVEQKVIQYKLYWFASYVNIVIRYWTERFQTLKATISVTHWIIFFLCETMSLD